jgi:glycosyltransferase involved in cell wall biosynthesis
MYVAMTFATDTRVVREARTLAQNGFDIEVLCWDRQGRRPAIEVVNDCLVRNMKFGKTSPLPNPRVYYVMAALLFQISIVLWTLKHAKLRHNLALHANDFNTLIGCVVAKRLMAGGTKLVYDSHELTPGVYREWYGSLIAAVIVRLELAALRHVDAIVAANEAIFSYLIRQSDAPGIVVHNCPSIGEIPRVSKSEAKSRVGLGNMFVVLFSGKVRQDYDLNMILEAAHELKRRRASDFKFVFIGLSGAETIASLVKLVRKGHLDHMFCFRGWVNDELWLSYYLASDICFAVTRNLGWNTQILTPNRIFESMSCSVPVIVRDQTLAADIVKKWGCGIAIRSTSGVFFAELLQEKRRKRSLRVLGGAGRRAFLAEYNWDKMEERLLRLYERIASHKEEYDRLPALKENQLKE